MSTVNQNTDWVNYLVPSVKTPLINNVHHSPEDLDWHLRQLEGEVEAYHCAFNVDAKSLKIDPTYNAPSFKSYQGPHAPFWNLVRFDFDSEGGTLAYQDAKRFVQDLGITDLLIAYTGNKGFDIGVPFGYFGLTPSEHLAKDLTALMHQLKKHYPTLDTGVHEPAQKWRALESRHPKTGRVKRRLELEFFLEGPFERILEACSEKGRPFFLPGVSDLEADQPREVLPFFQPFLAQINTKKDSKNNFERTSKNLSPFESYQHKVCIGSIAKAELKTGERHEALLRLADDFFKIGIPYDAALNQLIQWGTRNGLVAEGRTTEITGIVEEAYRSHPYNHGCYDPLKNAHCSSQCGTFRYLKAEVRREVERREAKEKKQKTTSASCDAERIKQLLPHKEGNKILGTIDNFIALLKELKVTARYNVITKDEEILIPGEAFLIDNKANASIAWILSWCVRVGIPKASVEDYLSYIISQNLYNPVTTWIESKPWDGENRLEEFYSTLVVKSEHEELKKILMRRWLISAIAAAFNPQGVSAHGVLVLQGEQYLGKTQWFKRLAPQELGVIAEGRILKPDDRDSVKQVVSNWLVELGELDATFRKSDIAQLKAFLTKDKDVLRRPFARRESEYARRTVFFASVNPQQFLHDPTGNRRFWTIECERIQHDHAIDMQQLWAEVHEALYQKGESWFLSNEELQLLNTHNETFQAMDAVEERILTDFNWKTPEDKWEWKTATQILAELGIDRPNQSELKKATQTVCKMNGKLRRRQDGRTEIKAPRRTFEPGL